MDIIEAQDNLLKQLEECAFEHYKDPYGDDSIYTLDALMITTACCRLIGIEDDIIKENVDIGKQRGLEEYKSTFI